MSDTFYSVQLWSNPWPRRITTVKMYDDQCLSGIGWISLNEYTSHKAAMDSARFARECMRQGESDDSIFVKLGHQLP